MATQLSRIETLARMIKAIEEADEVLLGKILTELFGDDAALKSIAMQLVALATAQSAQTEILKQIEREINAPPGEGGPLRLTIAVPILLNKQGMQVMPGTVTFTDDHDEKVMLNWADDVGAVHPTTSTTVVSSDPTKATGDVSTDNNFLFVRSVSDGECDLTLTNGPATDTIHVIIGPPVPTTLSIDASTAVSVPKGSTV